MAVDRYFYLMLKENFYDDDDIVILESMENGYLYSNILLKLYLKCLKNKGKLMFREHIPYDIKMLASSLRHNIDVVRVAIDLFITLGIIEKLDNGAMYMLDIENFIGKSSTQADRQREYGRRIAEDKQVVSIIEPNSCKNSCKKSYNHIDLNLNTNLDLNTNLNLDTNLKAKQVLLQEKDTVDVNVEDSVFMEFWKLYPRKVGKGAAEKAWKKAKPSKKLKLEIIAALKNAIASKAWTNENGKYIPNPARWINEKRWGDEPTGDSSVGDNLSRLYISDEENEKE